MRILSARFVNGRLDVPDGTFREGDSVTLLVSDAERTFELNPEERSRLADAISQIDRGEAVDGWRLLDELKD